jgi:hypothetical protein
MSTGNGVENSRSTLCRCVHSFSLSVLDDKILLFGWRGRRVLSSRGIGSVVVRDGDVVVCGAHCFPCLLRKRVLFEVRKKEEG